MKTKIHTKYTNIAGNTIPSVTTVLSNVLAKPALLDWAWKCGKDGLDYRKVRDDAGSIGTLAHYLILCHFKNEKPDLSDYTPEQVSKAENSLLKFHEWKKQNIVEPLWVEKPLISEEYQYGGTIDLLAKVNGQMCLVDFKSGKGIYEEMTYQLAAYENLITENNPSGCYNPLDKSMILRIGKDETLDFEIKSWTDLHNEFEIFKNCLSIYNLKKHIKGETK